MPELDIEVLEEAGLAKQSKSDGLQTGRKAGTGRKADAVAQIDVHSFVEGDICLAADASGEGSGKGQQVETEQNGDFPEGAVMVTGRWGRYAMAAGCEGVAAIALGV